MEIFGWGTGATAPGRTDRPPDQLDKHDFLRLLTVQLRYQDPVDPIKDQDFIAQMAQFTSLEQIQNLSVQLERFVDSQMGVTLMGQATAVLGKSVTVYDAESDQYLRGIVESIQVSEGVPKVVVGGNSFSVLDIAEVAK